MVWHTSIHLVLCSSWFIWKLHTISEHWGNASNPGDTHTYLTQYSQERIVYSSTILLLFFSDHFILFAKSLLIHYELLVQWRLRKFTSTLCLLLGQIKFVDKSPVQPVDKWKCFAEKFSRIIHIYKSNAFLTLEGIKIQFPACCTRFGPHDHVT